jgi:hypothetical protein
MTEDELQAIEARAIAATPGPWVPSESGRGILKPEDASTQHESLDWNFIASARTDVPALVAEVRRAVGVIRAVIDASDGCQGHSECAHSMKPWFDARELLYQFDNEQDALADLRSRASHERYRP